MVCCTKSSQIRRDAMELSFQPRQSELPVRPGCHARTRTVQEKDSIGFIFAADVCVSIIITSFYSCVRNCHKVYPSLRHTCAATYTLQHKRCEPGGVKQSHTNRLFAAVQ